MSASKLPSGGDGQYRHILGIRFYVGKAHEAVERGARPGLVIVPAAPALVEMSRDANYRQALLEADLVITDSGLMVIFWNIMMKDSIHRVSGLRYLKVLLQRPEFRKPHAVLWVMPSEQSSRRNMRWLCSQDCPTQPEDCYVAPKYDSREIEDEELLKLIRKRQPRHIIIGLGGGVQERLGLYLKRRCDHGPAIHCIGAAIGFLSGDQVRIPAWADQWVLGWLFRCASNPGRFVPRYAKGLRLPITLWRYRNRMPELGADSSPIAE
jgi:N-acetylglucosaminyldiphosphoundecaprenol N-acetyl-beta-D-mannosaminyltransferase